MSLAIRSTFVCLTVLDGKSGETVVFGVLLGCPCSKAGGGSTLVEEKIMIKSASLVWDYFKCITA